MPVGWRVGHAKELIGLRRRCKVRKVHSACRLQVSRQLFKKEIVKVLMCKQD